MGDGQSEACSDFTASTLRNLERGGSLPKSQLLELLETCGSGFLNSIYCRPKLSLSVAPPLVSLVLGAKLSPTLISRAAALLDLAASAGYHVPVEAVSRLMRNPVSRNRAWRMGLVLFTRDPLRIVASRELLADKSFAALLKRHLRGVELEEVFSEAMRKRIDFQSALALFTAADRSKAITFLAAKLLSHGREASLALRLLIAMGVAVRVAAETPAALAVASLAGEEVRSSRPEVLDAALREVQAAAIFLDRNLPDKMSREAVRRTAEAFVRLAKSGEPHMVAQGLVGRMGLLLSAAEVWEKHGVLEELAQRLRSALGVYVFLLYAASLQYTRGGRRSAVAGKLARLFAPAPGEGVSGVVSAIELKRGFETKEAGKLSGYTVYVDVSNVIGKQGELSLDDLRGFIEKLAEEGVEEIVLCYDSNLPWKLFGHLARDKRRLYSAFRQQLFRIEEYARGLGLAVRVVNPIPGQSADELIVEGVEKCLAEGRKCVILSNDRYSEYAKKLSWLRNENLFIRFRYDGDRLILYRMGRKI